MPHITSQFTWGNVSTCEICKTKSCKSRLAVITQRQKQKQIRSPTNTKKEFLRSSFTLLLLLLLLVVCCLVFVLLCLFGCLSVVLLLLLLLICLRTHLSSIVIPSFRLSAKWSADERRRKDRLGYLLSIARWPTGWYHRCVAAPCAVVRNFGTLKLSVVFFPEGGEGGSLWRSVCLTRATKSFSCRCEVRSDYIHLLDFQSKTRSVKTFKLNNDSILRPCQMYSYEKKGAVINQTCIYVYVVSVIYAHIAVELRVTPKAYLSACARSNNPHTNHWLLFQIDAIWCN